MLLDTQQRPSLLHGCLAFTISAAKNLPPPQLIHGVFRKKTTDPCVVVTVGEHVLLKTTVKEDTSSPRWSEDFRVNVCCAETNLIVKVIDKDFKTGQTLGSVSVPCRELSKEHHVGGWKTLLADDFTTLKATIKFTVSYTPAEELSTELAVPGSYYPARKQTNLVLYQDAHSVSHNHGILASRNCFEDLYNSILTAKKFIYISGRLDPKMKLIRGQKRTFELGKLLARRARAGVTVLILHWREESRLLDIKAHNQPDTATTDVKEAFRGTGVKLVTVERTKTKSGFLKRQLAGTSYDHNQRFLVLDAPDPSSPNPKRALVAYVGALEMDTGSWDTPDHHPFATLAKEHRDDFLQPAFPADPLTGPRLPQHGVHCRVDGRAAFDILRNFEDRWRCQVPSKRALLYKVNSNKFTLKSPSKQGRWSVQVFRSLNEDSGVLDEESSALKRDKGRLIDNGLHSALVHHIRRSQKFLYIETSHFMGRCWRGGGGATARDQHLVALEIVSKICEKIFAGKRYAVYVVLPLYPTSGDPTSGEVQEMLFWQTQTMDMMYKMVAKAISKKGPVGARVTDYLNFYCLGVRVPPSEVNLPESEEEEEEEGVKKKKQTVPEAATNARNQIGVSGTVFVADDEYLLVSGGGVCHRTLSGKRNTELAVGAWQPRHTLARLAPDSPHLQGKVHQFRLSLWAEHTGISSPSFRRPHRIGCVRELNRLANENWRCYVSGEEGTVTPSSLLKYPVAIQSSGQVVSRKDARFLPDTKARTMGRRMRVPSEKLTS